jgi:hypothetical protein
MKAMSIVRVEKMVKFVRMIRTIVGPDISGPDEDLVVVRALKRA